MQRAVERSLLASTRALSLDDVDRPRPALEYKRRLSLALDPGGGGEAGWGPGPGPSRILPFSCPAATSPLPPPPLSPALSAFNTRRE